MEIINKGDFLKTVYIRAPLKLSILLEIFPHNWSDRPVENIFLKNVSFGHTHSMSAEVQRFLQKSRPFLIPAEYTSEF